MERVSFQKTWAFSLSYFLRQMKSQCKCERFCGNFKGDQVQPS